MYSGPPLYHRSYTHLESPRLLASILLHYHRRSHLESPRLLASILLHYHRRSHLESPRLLAGAVTDTSLRSVVPTQRPRPPSPFQSTREPQACPPPSRGTEAAPGHNAVAVSASHRANWGKTGCRGEHPANEVSRFDRSARTDTPKARREHTAIFPHVFVLVAGRRPATERHGGVAAAQTGGAKRPKELQKVGTKVGARR